MFVGCLRDITERNALRLARGEVSRVTQRMAMGEMAAAIVREINQPSAAVAANANEALRLLAGFAPDLDKARAALKRIVNDSQRVNEVIDNIRLMFNTDRPTKAPLDVNELIREVITLVHDEIESQRVLVSTELANELPRVPANLVQLRQVIMNLVTNAIDAMHAVADRNRVLRIKTEIYERSHLIITVKTPERGLIRRTSTAFRAILYNEIRPSGLGTGASMMKNAASCKTSTTCALAGTVEKPPPYTRADCGIQ